MSDTLRSETNTVSGYEKKNKTHTRIPKRIHTQLHTHYAHVQAQEWEQIDNGEHVTEYEACPLVCPEGVCVCVSNI